MVVFTNSNYKNKSVFFFLCFLFLIGGTSSFSQNITTGGTITVSQTVENITLGNQNDLTLNAGVVLTVTGNISLGEETDILGDGILFMNGSGQQTITFTSNNWYKVSQINYIKFGTHNILLVREANRTVNILTIDYNCGNATLDKTLLINTPIEINKPIQTLPSISNNSPQCVGNSITFTQSDCPSGATCFWQTSAYGVDESNSDADLTSSSDAGTYQVWLRAKREECWSNAVTSEGTVVDELTIIEQPSNATVHICVGNSFADELSAFSFACPNSISYQWFVNTDAINTSGTPIAGATSSTYIPEHTNVGTYYYYCEISDGVTALVSDVSGAHVIHELPIAVASVSKTTVYSNDSFVLTAEPSAMSVYSWTSQNGGYTSSEQNPIVQNPSTTYSGYFQLVVTDMYGCVSLPVQTSSVTVSPSVDYNYYGVGDITDKANWWTGASNGSGVNPPDDFVGGGRTYHIKGAVASWTKDWVVNGESTRIKCTQNMTIPTTYSLQTNDDVVVDVAASRTLTISNTIVPKLGLLDTTCTIIYNAAGNQLIQANSYGNITIGGSSARTVTLESGVISCYGVFNPEATNCTYITNGNTFVFNRLKSQNIPAFVFNNLHTEMGGTKTLTGEVTVNGLLRIGAITKLNASDKILNLTGAGTVIVEAGKFIPGTSTVNYTSASSAVVAGMDYYNLNTSGGNRVLVQDSLINIAHTFTPGAGSFTITKSKVRFNGNVAQTIPAFTFNDLIIANTNGGVTLGGEVLVGRNFILEDGIVTTTETNLLTVTNTAVNAVSQGKTTSFVNGPFKRSLPSSLNGESYDEYVFPVGKSTTFLPFKINSVTTSSNPSLVIEAFLGNCGGSGSGLSALSSSEYWKATAAQLSSASVSLARQTALGTLNAIGHSTTQNGTYANIEGTVSGLNTVKNSNVTLFSYFVLGQRESVPVTYTLIGGADPSVLSSWTRTAGTGDATPVSFAIDDATWIINSNATATFDWHVSGSNSIVQINNTYTLTIAEDIDVVVSGVLKQEGNISTEIGSSLTVYGGYVHTHINGGAKPNSLLDNSGTIILYTDFSLTDIEVINQATGTIQLISANFKMYHTGDANNDDPTNFINYGILHAVNSNFTIESISNSTVDVNPKFVNANGGVVYVDNSVNPNGKVMFGDYALLNEDFLHLDEGSTFFVKGSDLEISHQNSSMEMKGLLIVEDGNISSHVTGGGGGTIEITFPSGGVYVYDTDNSGDGMLDLQGSGGGYKWNIYGTLFATGVAASSGGGGNTITSMPGGTIFIGNLGADLDGTVYVFSIDVQGGGTLNYCGNISAFGDDVGDIASGGYLNYAESYYTTQNPVSQADFNDAGGTIVPLYSSMAECVAAFDFGARERSQPLNDQFLPIELTMLYAVCKDSKISIVWQTASETNNHYFVLYRSFDGITFESIAQIDGAGTTSYMQNYEFVDDVSYAGIVYYKIAQVDFDGTVSYSKIVVVHTCSKSACFSRINNTTVAIEFEQADELNHVIITNLAGKIVYSSTYKGVPVVQVQLPSQKGIYIVSNITKNTIVSYQALVK